jgi:FlaA1/EpsC-like NDP-sugar epimerase
LLRSHRQLDKTALTELSSIATQREIDLFSADLVGRNLEIKTALENRRVLVIGGAGSIGSATIREIVKFHPGSLHVVDINENNLAELVRDLRSNPQQFEVPDLRTLPIDFGSPIMHRYLIEEKPYDYVLNFAAIKHVRSEKDTYSLLQMLDTNIIKPVRLLRWLIEKGGTKGYFCVSTDKAANPINLMGASKRLMECVIFSQVDKEISRIKRTSARFANVAFSDGSLLQSWLKRIEKRQPLAVPENTRRFFISLPEAGQICVLAAMCAPDLHLLIPRLIPASDLKELQTIAEAVIAHYGFKPSLYRDERAARASVLSDLQQGLYPLLITPLDTDGEKPYEEFIGINEESIEIGLTNILAIRHHQGDRNNIMDFIERVEELLNRIDISVSKSRIIQQISTVIPAFHHIETGRSLDDRM